MNKVEGPSGDETVKYKTIADWSTYFSEFKQGNTNSLGYTRINNFELKNAIIDSDVMFMEVYEYPLNFENCIFNKNVTFFDCTFKMDFYFANCIFKGDFGMMADVSFKENFFINGTDFKKIIVIDGEYNKCNWGISKCEEILIGKSVFKDLTVSFEGIGADKFIINANELSGRVIISGLGSCINKLEIGGGSKNLDLTIEDININQVSIHRFRNDGAFRILKIHPEGTKGNISISESYLGKAEFYLIDFSTFQSIVIIDTYLVDCAFVNIIWPKTIISGVGKTVFDDQKGRKFGEGLTERQLYYTKQKETFRQLKYAMSKQGDVVNEQKFHALEMESYNNSLSWKWGNRSLKCIIILSRISSDFGQSIWRPLLWLLSLNLIFFSGLFLSDVFYPLHFSVEHPSWEGFWSGVYEYFWLINPLRKVDDTFRNGFIIIDLIARITSSYMIYNFIRASRRFIK